MEDDFLENIENLKRNVKLLREEIESTNEKIAYCVKSSNLILSKEIKNFLNSWQEFKVTLIDDCERLEEAINTPIYIGIIGHYSHGKSSLLNALISHPKMEDEILPTGENIVTSKITLIQFKAGSDVERFGCKESGEKEYIPEEGFKRLVAGKMNNPWDYFTIELGYDKSVDEELFSSLSKYNIVLFDTPGLGSSYWSDRSELKGWLETFDIVFLCIDGTKIDSRLTAVLSESLSLCKSKTVIPIITKWDLWRECEIYKGISDEFMARQKAKDLLNQYLPSLNESLTTGLIYFVSAYNYIKGVDLPSELSKEYTEFWNIDQVRNEIKRLVIENNSFLRKHKESAKLAKKRKKEISEAIENIKKDFDKYITQCEEALPSFQLKHEVIQIFNEGYRDFERKVREKCINIASDITNIIQDGVNGLHDYSQIGNQQLEIEIKVENARKRLIEEYKETDVEHWFYEAVKNPVIKKLGVLLEDEEGRNKIGELEETMVWLMSKYKRSISSKESLFQPVDYNVILLKEIAIESFRRIITTIGEYSSFIISGVNRGISLILANKTVLLVLGITTVVLLILWGINQTLKDWVYELECQKIKPWTWHNCVIQILLFPVLKFSDLIFNYIINFLFFVVKKIGIYIFNFLQSYAFWIVSGLITLFAIFYMRSFIIGVQNAKREVLNSVKEKLRNLYSFENVKKNVNNILKIENLHESYEIIKNELTNLLDETQKDEVVTVFKRFFKSANELRQKICDIDIIFQRNNI